METMLESDEGVWRGTSDRFRWGSGGEMIESGEGSGGEQLLE